jgi:GPH family glycoside/pentoside/hexuronide:cation symporter
MAKLPVATKLGFGVGDVGGNLFFTVLSFWGMKYLTDSVLLAGAAAGLAMSAGRLIDAVFDPVLGLLSDRTRTRWGRRRPYLLFGAIPVALVFVFFFMVPNSHDQTFLFWWATITLVVLNMSYSVVNIPYSSLTPELTTDYDERMSLGGFRMGFAVVGTILGAVAFGMVAQASPGDAPKGYFIAGLVFGSVMAVSTLITAFSVREPLLPVQVSGTVFGSWKKVLTNGPFVIVIAAYVVNILGITFVSSMLAYYFEYVLHDAGATTLAMAILLLTAAAFIPVSVVLSGKIGKVRTYQLSMLLLAAACALIGVLGPSVGVTGMFVIMAFAGIGMGFGYAPPFALVPDTIEVVAQRTGFREEGSYYGFMTFSTKLGQSLASLVIGTILGLAGYAANQAQSDSSLAAIQLITSPLPVAMFLLAAVLLQFYPLDKKTYQSLVK